MGACTGTRSGLSLATLMELTSHHGSLQQARRERIHLPPHHRRAVALVMASAGSKPSSREACNDKTGGQRQGDDHPNTLGVAVPLGDTTPVATDMPRASEGGWGLAPCPPPPAGGAAQAPPAVEASHRRSVALLRSPKAKAVYGT